MVQAKNDIAANDIYTIEHCLYELIVNTDLQHALLNTTRWLSENLNIDAMYLAESTCTTDDYCSYKPFTIATATLAPGNSSFQAFTNSDAFKTVTDELRKNGFCICPANDGVPSTTDNFMQQADLRSLLFIRLLRQDIFAGFVAFGDKDNYRLWRKNEPKLGLLSTAIGASIESHRSKNEIQQRQIIYNSTLTGLKEFVWEIDLVNQTSKTTAGSNLFTDSVNGDGVKDINEWLNQYCHPDDKQRVQDQFSRFLQKEDNAIEEQEMRLLNNTGQYTWIHSRHRLVKNAEGLAIAITGSITDINDTRQAAFEQEKQKEQYEFLVQSIGQVIFTVNNRGNFTFLNKAWQTLLGYTLEECIATNFINYIPEEQISIYWESIGSLLSNTNNMADRQMQMLDKAGNTIWVRVVAKTIKDQNEQVEGIFGTIENINSRYSAELVLEESNEKLTTILNSSKEIILTIDLETNKIENVNEAISILEYKPEDWIGLNYKRWSNDQRSKFHELMKLAVKSQLQVSNQHISFSNKSNTAVIPFEFSTSIFSFKNSRYLLCVLRDTRERVEYEQNLSRISNQLTHLINNIDDVYAIFDLPTSRFEFVSNNVESLYDCSKEEFISRGLLWPESIHIEDLPGVQKAFQHLLHTGSKGEFFYRIMVPGHDVRMVLEKITVGKNACGEAEKLYIVKTDYTHIENVERSSIESERKFRFISENISDFISIHDTDWNFTYASPAVTNILGYDPEEIVGLDGLELVHPDDLVRTLDKLLKPLVLEQKETHLRYRLKARDGGYKWVETYSKAVLDSKKETSSIISSTRDVTDQVEAENRLKTSEEQYRLLSENSNDVIATYNPEGKFLYVSPSSLQVLGFLPHELAGKTTGVLAADEGNAALVNENIKAVAEGRETASFIYKAATATGEHKTLEVVMQPVIKNNEVVAIQSASRDVTEREKLLVELEQSLAKERELNELRSMFVATASHQFRTPLTVIQSGIEIMELYVGDLPENKQEKFKKQFHKIQGEVERLEYLMSDILVLGRANAARTPFNPETGDLVTFTQRIIEEKYNNRYTADRSVILQVAGTNVPVQFDHELIGHAIENIISNAYKYSEQGNLDAKISFGKRRVCISISDHGMGIPAEDLKNLFQPFYRATNTNDIEGTGLGLAIVKEFVEKHEGKIFLTSLLNKGTTVNVILPVKQKAPSYGTADEATGN